MGRTLGTVLVLPGGRPVSWELSRAHQLANIRMRPITSRLSRELGDSYSVHQVRYRYRGWNAPQLPALDDVRKAMDTDQPIVLVGHSMGGRVAAHVSAKSDIQGIVALAPWWPQNDGALIDAPHLVTIHGTADRWTDPAESHKQTADAADRGIAATYHVMPGAGHFMLARPKTWHDLVCDSVVNILAAHRSPHSLP